MADSLKEDKFPFLEYKKCEITKENVEITDQIYEELKEIRILQKKKQMLARERYELLDQSQPLRWDMMQDRVKMENICKKSLKERECWEERRKLMKDIVHNLGESITTKETYINTALDITQRYLGDHFRRLLNTKMAYTLHLARTLLKETESMHSLTKKKRQEMRIEQANQMVKACEKLESHMKIIQKKTSTSERFWRNGVDDNDGDNLIQNNVKSSNSSK